MILSKDSAARGANKMSTEKKRPRLLEQPRAKSESLFRIKEKQAKHVILDLDFKAAGPVCTAIPRGTTWAVKAINADGGLFRFGAFKFRDDAMRVAALLAESVDGRVLR